MTHQRLALRIGAWLGLALLLLVGNGPVSAHHSYLLTVQQLKAGLSKSATPSSKGFFLIDVR